LAVGAEAKAIAATAEKMLISGGIKVIKKI
jgi:hypothetical protein